jgi:alpha-tubulin suppressor-like RCC1 family protein
VRVVPRSAIVALAGFAVGGALGAGPATALSGRSSAPTARVASAAAPVAALAAGIDQTCELLAGGGVDCWGANGDGQLGDGTSDGPQTCNGEACASNPVAVRGLTGASQIAAGGDQSCALLAAGKVDCWGANGYGQLGDATSSGPQTCNGQACASTPVTVHGITTATAVAVGGEEACALLAGGAVDCWGANGYGQLGDATSSGPQTCNGQACASTPVTVHGITTATAVAAGNDHACALLAGGAVDCWGYNFAAELGVGTSSGPQWCAGGEWCATLPVAVTGIAGATQLAAGGDHTCAVVARGSLACWGYNTYGQLGDAISSGPQICYWQLVQCAKTPVAVHVIADATAVVAGGDHTCALRRGGGVACWGDNWFGDLGNGSRSGPASCNGYPCSATPVSVGAPQLTGSAAPGDRRARSAGARTRTPATAWIRS